MPERMEASEVSIPEVEPWEEVFDPDVYGQFGSDEGPLVDV